MISDATSKLSARNGIFKCYSTSQLLKTRQKQYMKPQLRTHSKYTDTLFCLVSEQQKKAKDKIEADSAIYAEPTEPIKKSSDKHIYDTPATKGKPIGQEPQVIEASGFFNPLYQTRQDVMQYPDISSIFATPSPPPDKQLDHEPGESSC